MLEVERRRFPQGSSSGCNGQQPGEVPHQPIRQYAVRRSAACTGGGSPAPFPDVAAAKQYENGLPDDYYVYLTTGNLPSGLSHGDVDTRIPATSRTPTRITFRSSSSSKRTGD